MTMVVKELCDIEQMLPVACDEWRDICFKINKTNAIDILVGYGSWEYADLKRESLHNLKLMLVWLAAWNASENNNYMEL